MEFNGGRKTLRIVTRVAANWERLAIGLGFDRDRISIIGRQVHFDPVEACFKMFDRWMTGEHGLKPPKWYYLIKCLEETSEFKDLAREVMFAINDSEN